MFPYRERGRDVEDARAEVDAAFRALRAAEADRSDATAPTVVAWRRAIERFGTSLSRAYPPHFRSAIGALKAGDPSGLDEAIAFLEADPWFFRSGYVKADVIRFINRVALTPASAERLRAVVLSAVDGRDRREFRHYCRLARRLDTAGLRDALAQRRRAGDAAVGRRAAWMLAALAQDGAPRVGPAGV